MPIVNDRTSLLIRFFFIKQNHGIFIYKCLCLQRVETGMWEQKVMRFPDAKGAVVTLGDTSYDRDCY